MRVKGIILSVLLLVGCNSKVEPVAFGVDSCDHCMMKIHDHRYGGEVLTKKGKSYKFDSIECLIKFEAEKLDKKEVVKERYVFDTFKKGELLKAEKAIYLNVPEIRSPMGLGIWASDSNEMIAKSKAEHGGAVLNWAQLKEVLEKQ